MAGYVLTPLARADLQDIWNYTVERWGWAQAERYMREIQETVALLASSPGLGRSCDEIRAGYFKFPAGTHVIYFRRRNSKTEIVRILHQRMDVERHL